MQRNTASLYLALAEKDSYDCLQGEKKQEWELLRSKNCNVFFTADHCSFFTRTCSTKHKKHDRRKPGLFQEDFRRTELLYLYSKIYCFYISLSNNFKTGSEELNKRAFEDKKHGLRAEN